MKHQHLDFAFDVKEFDAETGKFTGYGAVFGNLDSYRDIIQKGAFKRTLKEFKKKGRKVPMLWQHSRREPIGNFPVMKEDDKGLFVEGQLALKTQRGAEAGELMKMGAVTGLSIGYTSRKSIWDDDREIRTLVDIDLFETSVVTFPANDDARVEGIKECKTERDLERHLRESGLSRSQAVSICKHGFDGLRQRDAGCDRDIMASIDALRRTAIT